MPDKNEKTTGGMKSMRMSVRQDVADFFEKLAADLGVSQQSIVAPLLTAYARGKIKQAFIQAEGDVVIKAL